MRRTYCDRCGNECEARVGHLHFAVIHQTNKGETVSHTEYKPVELCGHCTDAVQDFVGEVLSMYEPGPGPDSAMMAHPFPQ
jgi:hypothetical protein